MPTATNVIVAPSTPPSVHTDGVRDVKVTAKPEEAEATAVTGDASNVVSGSAGNVIV